MRIATAFLAGLTAVLGPDPAGAGTGREHFDIVAAYLAPDEPGADAVVAVTFTPRDADVRVNQEPAPRLKLDDTQTVLLDKQPPPPKRVVPFDPATARYLDPAEPVRFAVAPAPGAAKGRHKVKAWVTFFYCSKSEGWCRKGSTELVVPVDVR